MRRYAFIPSSVAPLEERITPSHSGLASAAATPLASTQSHSVNLYGFVLGRDTTVGTVHRLRATGGTISPLGTVSLTGFLVIPNTGAANRPVHGKVTISNAQGTVTVSLRGTVTVYKASFSFASGNLRYKIVAGTKADYGATGAGPVLYGPGPVFQPGRFLLDFGHYPLPP
ncbi:MAG: hypothetical protein ACHRXM_17765 [Isosphaerales bacterium]